MTAIEYINSYSWLGSRPGLERISQLMEKLGNPQNSLRVVHLAGTNGKGSTACFLANIFQSAGLKTGLYTSPFIHTLHEQMQIDGHSISDDALNAVTEHVRAVADAMDDHPTTFELITAIAFCWFKEEGCEIVVLETGMGGELDSTNVVAAPKLCVITPIDMDHMEYLGRTIGIIAKAKAGIIKPNCPVVTSRQHTDAMNVLEETAARQNSKLIKVDWDKLEKGKFSFDGQYFSFGELNEIKISLLGEYQIENAVIAITAIKELIKQGMDINETAIYQGLKTARWMGRFELVTKGDEKNPTIIVDGGHNAQGALALASNLKRYFPNEKIVFIMGVLADKDLNSIISPVLPIAKQFFTITPNSPRAMDASKLADYINEKGISAVAVNDVSTAFKKAKNEGKVVCYFGSLYGVGAALKAFSGLH